MARDSFSQNTYDPNEVYDGGTSDANGHSSNIRAHIPPSWVSVIMEFVSSDEWPEYKTPQDFYRDAIYHRMMWAQRQPDRTSNERVRALMAIAANRAVLANAITVQETSQELLDEARHTLGAIARNGNSVVVREVLKELESNLDDMIEPYRGQLRYEIETWERRISM